MMERLKGTLKNELEALKSGNPIEEGTPKKADGTPKSTPRKRKAKDDGDGEASPTKRGRKKKGVVTDEPVDDEEELKVKDEVFEDQI